MDFPAFLVIILKIFLRLTSGEWNGNIGMRNMVIFIELVKVN